MNLRRSIGALMIWMSTLRFRIRRGALRVAYAAVSRVPLPAIEQPFEIFIAALCVASGLPLIIGVAPNPASIEALLPPAIVAVWGLNLVAGGALICTGLLVRRFRIAERVGLSILAPTSIVYAVAIIRAQYTGGLVAGAIVVGFGISCLLRIFALLAVAAIREREASRPDWPPRW